jgi:hypothetical protein
MSERRVRGKPLEKPLDRRRGGGKGGDGDRDRDLDKDPDPDPDLDLDRPASEVSRYRDIFTMLAQDEK